MSNTDVFTIVAGVDGSPQSREALAWAVDEARLRGGRVIALTAWEFPILTAGGPETFSMDQEAFAKVASGLLHQTVDTISGVGVPIEMVVDHGSPAKVMMEAAEGADLVVVGSRGLGGFEGLLLGSVSAHLVHHSPCTVVVVRRKV